MASDIPQPHWLDHKGFSPEFRKTLRRAHSMARQGGNAAVTLDHLFLALVGDEDAGRRFGHEKLNEVMKVVGNRMRQMPAGSRNSEPFEDLELDTLLDHLSQIQDDAGGILVSGLDALDAMANMRSTDLGSLLHEIGFVSAPLPPVGFNLPRIEPPPIPSQSHGAYYEINEQGIVVRAPPSALDKQGNHATRLRSLYPDICELTRALSESLNAGNRPHALLADRVAAYAAHLGDDLSSLDFGRLYIAGLRLENSLAATFEQIAKDDLPALEADQREMSSSLIMLHGTFILASAEGAALRRNEERFQRVPEQERQLAAEAVVVARELLKHPEIVEPEAAKEALEAAEEIGKGPNRERSNIAGSGPVRNLLIGVMGGAIGGSIILNAGPIISGGAVVLSGLAVLVATDTVRKMSWYKFLTDRAAAAGDSKVEAASKGLAARFVEGLQRQGAFVSRNEKTLQRISKISGDFQFVQQMLDWMKAHSPVLTGTARHRIDIFGSIDASLAAFLKLQAMLVDLSLNSHPVSVDSRTLDARLHFPDGGTAALLRDKRLNPSHALSTVLSDIREEGDGFMLTIRPRRGG